MTEKEEGEINLFNYRVEYGGQTAGNDKKTMGDEETETARGESDVFTSL